MSLLPFLVRLFFLLVFCFSVSTQKIDPRLVKPLTGCKSTACITNHWPQLQLKEPSASQYIQRSKQAQYFQYTSQCCINNIHTHTLLYNIRRLVGLHIPLHIFIVCHLSRARPSSFSSEFGFQQSETIPAGGCNASSLVKDSRISLDISLLLNNWRRSIEIRIKMMKCLQR